MRMLAWAIWILAGSALLTLLLTAGVIVAGPWGALAVVLILLALMFVAISREGRRAR